MFTKTQMCLIDICRYKSEKFKILPRKEVFKILRKLKISELTILNKQSVFINVQHK